MAIPEITEAEVRRRIKTLTESDCVPELTDDNIDILVQQSFLPDLYNRCPELAFERVGSKAYVVGQRMVPMNRNGHRYICTTAGTTAATEPTFPGESEEIVIDGSVSWTETGTSDWVPTYNIFGVICDGWEMKAGKLTGNYQFSSDGQTFNRQQVFDHCMIMAESWRSRKVGSSRIQSEVRKRSRLPDAFAAQLPEQVLENLGWNDLP